MLTHQTSRLSGGALLGATLRSEPSLPSPDEWGLQKSDTQTWQPLWTKLPEASKTIQGTDKMQVHEKMQKEL